MFRWLRNFMRQQELRRLPLRKQIPDKPIVCFLREAIIFLRQIPEPMPLLEPHLRVCSFAPMSMALFRVTAWLGYNGMRSQPELVLARGIDCNEYTSSGELSEWIQCLEYLIENQEAFGQYFHISDKHLIFRDTISMAERLSISWYVRENYQVPRAIA